VSRSRVRNAMLIAYEHEYPMDTDFRRLVAIERLDLLCHGLPEVGVIKRPGDSYVKVILDGQTKKTSVAKATRDPVWNDLFVL
jgi:hypothetical protein